MSIRAIGTKASLRHLTAPRKQNRDRWRRALLCIGLIAAAEALAAAPAGALRLHRVGHFDQPVYATAPAGDKRRLFVAERRGRIEVLRRGHHLRRPFLDIRRLVNLRLPNNQFADQGGLLSMTFAPDYVRSGLFYILYTHRDGTIHLDELRRRSATRAARSSRRTLLTVPRKGRTDLGGDLAFGPDGLLYASIGQAGDSEASQRLDALTGKVLRIDPTPSAGHPYGIPAANPFAVTPGARPEIFGYGMRNPWRFSFDSTTGDLLIADVGDERVEEVDRLPPGLGGWNLGWPIFEGGRRHGPGSGAGLTAPVLTLSHTQGICAIVGGYVVRGHRLPSLRGRYLFGDVCSGRLRSARLGAQATRRARTEPLSVPYLDSFGRDGRGRLYALSLLGGVYRISR